MKRLFKHLSLTAALAICFNTAFAQSAEAPIAYPTDLPPLDQALTAIRQAPMAQAAYAMIGAEAANRDRLEAGPHEWGMRIEGQQRNVNGVQTTPSQRYSE